jgi:hypothetical protein
MNPGPRPSNPEEQAKQEELNRQQQLRTAARSGPHADLINRVDQLSRDPLQRPHGFMVPLPLSMGARYLFHDDGSIKALDLRLLKLTEADLAELSNHPRLEMLLLSHTEIADTAVEHLGKLRSLKTLAVSGTNLSPDGMQTLQQLLPMCQIRSE